MKGLAGIVLGVSGALALQAAGLAQVGSNPPAHGEGLSPTVETRSELLVTEPISVDAFSQATHVPSTFSIYDMTRLRQAADSLRANPGSGGKILNIIPPDLIRTPAAPTTDTRAIDFFQVPRPNRSVGINLSTQ